MATPTMVGTSPMECRHGFLWKRPCGRFKSNGAGISDFECAFYLEDPPKLVVFLAVVRSNRHKRGTKKKTSHDRQGIASGAGAMFGNGGDSGGAAGAGRGWKWVFGWLYKGTQQHPPLKLRNKWQISNQDF